jgi:hypothetical protein
MLGINLSAAKFGPLSSVGISTQDYWASHHAPWSVECFSGGVATIVFLRPTGASMRCGRELGERR